MAETVTAAEYLPSVEPLPSLTHGTLAAVQFTSIDVAPAVSTRVAAQTQSHVRTVLLGGCVSQRGTAGCGASGCAAAAGCRVAGR